MGRLTTEQLEAIRKRASLATEGPWFNANYHVATKPGVDGGYPPNPASICETCDGEYIENYNKADAAFIAHARTDIPKLLAEIERLQSESTYWRMERDHERKQAELYLEKYKKEKAEVERLNQVINLYETLAEDFDYYAILGEMGDGE